MTRSLNFKISIMTCVVLHQKHRSASLQMTRSFLVTSSENGDATGVAVRVGTDAETSLQMTRSFVVTLCGACIRCHDLIIKEILRTT